MAPHTALPADSAESPPLPHAQAISSGGHGDYCSRGEEAVAPGDQLEDVGHQPEHGHLHSGNGARGDGAALVDDLHDE